ncbi:MAG TPA: YHS domain-containing (seleno)protein [Microvirga sp.]|jgi:hypothetical protein
MSYRAALLALCLPALAAGPARAEPGSQASAAMVAPPPEARRPRLPWPHLVGAAEVYRSDEQTGLALGGFDPVSYFTPSGPQAGRPELEVLWSGVAWRFASEANRAAFLAAPQVYAPQMGGYDAEAASRGRIVDADPLLYLVSGERLYLFRTDAGRARFLADESVQGRGLEEWERLKAQLARS